MSPVSQDIYKMESKKSRVYRSGAERACLGMHAEVLGRMLTGISSLLPPRGAQRVNSGSLVVPSCWLQNFIFYQDQLKRPGFLLEELCFARMSKAGYQVGHLNWAMPVGSGSARLISVLWKQENYKVQTCLTA